jgi:L,D-transpeptidase ErfK/SrfK
MMPLRATAGPRAAFIGAVALLAGCSLLHPVPKAPPVAQTTAPPAPPLPRPTATHRFVVDGASGDVVGYVQRTRVGKDDTLPDIARRFDVGYEEMLLANPGVDPWLPGVGHEVVVPTQFVLPAAPREGVVVNVAAMRIFYYPPHKKDEPQVVYTHPIGIGKVGWKTPEGTTRVIAKEKDPVWVVPKSVREEHQENGETLPATVPAGPDNPLGAYEFRLGWPSYLIHGTNKPYGVGMRSSHGCMRLYPEDIQSFYEMIPIGTKVTVVNQPYLLGARDGTFYLQAYAPMEDDKRDYKDPKRLLATLLKPKLRKESAPREKDIDWTLVSAVSKAPRALPVPITGTSGGVDAVLARSVLVENTLPEGSNWDGQSGLLVDEKTFNDLVKGRAPTSMTVPPPTQTRQP